MHIAINGLQNIKFPFQMIVVYGFTIKINLKLNQKFVLLCLNNFQFNTILFFFFAQEFSANNDRNSERIHFLNEPFFARYIRLHPTEWHNHVSMRAAILGCPHQGYMICKN